MQYEFSFVSFGFGLIIVIAGVLFMRFHQVIADNLGGGMSSYDRYKLWALIACIVGVLVTFNLHEFLLGNLILIIFPHN
jgi:hypothetical protein